MDLQLQDKVASVTGASRGIGLAVARRLATEGARVVAASRSAFADLAGLGDAVTHVAVDLSKPQAPAEVVARALELHGGVDVLVDNVGGGPEVHGPRPSFLAVTDADFLRQRPAAVPDGGRLLRRQGRAGEPHEGAVGGVRAAGHPGQRDRSPWG